MDSQSLSREERLALWRAERRKAKAAAGKGGTAAGAVARKKPGGPGRRKVVNKAGKAKRLSGGAGCIAKRPLPVGGRYEPADAPPLAKKSGALSNVLGGPAMRLAVSSGRVKGVRSSTKSQQHSMPKTAAKKSATAKAKATETTAAVASTVAYPPSSENEPRSSNRRKRSLDSRPSVRVVSKPKHKTPKVPQRRSTTSATISSSNKRRFAKRTPPAIKGQGRSSPALSQLSRRNTNKSGITKSRELPLSTPDATAVASSVPLPAKPAENASTAEISDDDLMSPLVNSAKPATPQTAEGAAGGKSRGRKRSKAKKKRRRRRQSICFDAQAMAELSDDASPVSMVAVDTHLEINKKKCATIDAPCQASTLEAVLASPIVDFSEPKPTALGEQVSTSTDKTLSSAASTAQATATASSTSSSMVSSTPTSATTSSSIYLLANGPTGRLIWQAALHRAKYQSLTKAVTVSQARVHELEVRLAQAEACNERIVAETAKVVYARDEIAHSLSLARSSIVAQNEKDDTNADEEDDVDTLLGKLKRAEKKIASLMFENEMTMQEMAQQAEAFEEEMEQETVARDMDVRAAEARAAEAL